jgi:hypothetical protein
MPQRGKSLVERGKIKDVGAASGQYIGCSIISVLPRWGVQFFSMLVLQGFCRGCGI